MCKYYNFEFIKPKLDSCLSPEFSKNERKQVTDFLSCVPVVNKFQTLFILKASLNLLNISANIIVQQY